jgi:hypothetical protein
LIDKYNAIFFTLVASAGRANSYTGGIIALHARHGHMYGLAGSLAFGSGFFYFVTADAV